MTAERRPRRCDGRDDLFNEGSSQHRRRDAEPADPDAVRPGVRSRALACRLRPRRSPGEHCMLAGHVRGQAWRWSGDHRRRGSGRADVPAVHRRAPVLVVAERSGKGVRTAAADTRLAQASSKVGRRRAFAYHQDLDQLGALRPASGRREGGDFRVPDPGSLSSPSSASSRCSCAQFWALHGLYRPGRRRLRPFWVLTYRLPVRHVVTVAPIPVIYAVTTGVDALAVSMHELTMWATVVT